MPPAPIAAVISYGPRRAPGARVSARLQPFGAGTALILQRGRSGAETSRSGRSQGPHLRPLAAGPAAGPRPPRQASAGFAPGEMLKWRGLESPVCPGNAQPTLSALRDPG